MSLTRIEDGLRDFASAGGSVHRKPADSPDAIAHVAEALELELPPPFRELYEAYDCIAYGPVELLPVDRLAEEYDVVHNTFRSLSRGDLPFIADDAGGYYLISCGVEGTNDSEFGCVSYIPGTRGANVQYKAADFPTFLLSHLEFWKDEI